MENKQKINDINRLFENDMKAIKDEQDNKLKELAIEKNGFDNNDKKIKEIMNQREQQESQYQNNKNDLKKRYEEKMRNLSKKEEKKIRKI